MSVGRKPQKLFFTDVTRTSRGGMNAVSVGADSASTRWASMVSPSPGSSQNTFTVANTRVPAAIRLTVTPFSSPPYSSVTISTGDLPGRGVQNRTFTIGSGYPQLTLQVTRTTRLPRHFDL